MKKIILILLVAATLFSCSNNDKKIAENTALIEKYIKAVENLDFETVESLLDENYLGLGPSVGDSIGKEMAIANWKENSQKLYESIKYAKSRNIGVVVSTGDNQGEWVSNWAELKITYKKDKKNVTIWANTIYQVLDNKIVKSYTFYNEADALEQLGYVFINPNDL